MNWTGGQRSSSLSLKVQHTNHLKQCVKRLKLMRLEMEIRHAQNGATTATVPGTNNKKKRSSKEKTVAKELPKKRSIHPGHYNEAKRRPQDFALKTSIESYKSTRKLAIMSHRHHHHHAQ